MVPYMPCPGNTMTSHCTPTPMLAHRDLLVMIDQLLNKRSRGNLALVSRAWRSAVQGSVQELTFKTVSACCTGIDVQVHLHFGGCSRLAIHLHDGGNSSMAVQLLLKW